MTSEAAAKFWLKEVAFKLDVLTLMAVHGNLLLALRHPQNIGESRELVVKFVKEIGYELAFLGAIKPGQLLEAYREEANHGVYEFDEDLEEITARVKEIAEIREQMKQQVIANDKIIREYIIPALQLSVTPFILREEKDVEQFIMTADPDSFMEMLCINARCCACGNQMSLTPSLNFMQLNKKAKWKYPVWDNLLLKPGIERIPRAMAVMCDACMGSGKLPKEVIEIEGKKIQYHKVSELEDAFEITADMVAGKIKDLRSCNTQTSITDTLPPIPPAFWKDEIEGKMAPIIENFFDDVPLGPNDLKILQWYMYQWIAALPGKPENYQDVQNMNQDELKKYLHDVLLPMGIDPF